MSEYLSGQAFEVGGRDVVEVEIEAEVDGIGEGNNKAFVIFLLFSYIFVHWSLTSIRSVPSLSNILIGEH